MKEILAGIILLLTVAVQASAFDEGDYSRLMRTGDCPGCDLRGALLSWADLRLADLKGADLSGADLTRTNLKGAVMTGANLQGVIFCRTVMPDGKKNNSGCKGSKK